MPRFALVVLCFVGALLPLGASAQLSPDERKGIEDALYLRNLTTKDLEFARRAKGESVMPAVIEAIDHPLAAADAMMRLHRGASGDLSTVLGTALAQLQVAPVPSEPTVVQLPPEVPAPLQAPLLRLIGALATANREVAASLEKLSPEERRTLIETLPTLAAGSNVTFGFVKGEAASPREVNALLPKVDLPRLLAAAGALAKEVQAQIPVLKATRVELLVPLRFNAGGVPVEMTGTGNDLHSATAAGLCIDLGGNDVYTGRYGAGSGLASVLIDLAGNDTYDVPDLSIGAGLLGIGLAYDLGGHDRFRGRSINFGAGILGVGCLFKDGGDDIYKGTSLCEGFARNGVGLLMDTRGDDAYRLGFSGQGASQSGGLGWLVDQAGADDYVATYGKAQGSSTQGIGLITDLAGDDSYRGASNCQATGLAGGIGSLYDASGRDEYTNDRASLSFASDGGAAFFFDLGGNDVYSTRGGACEATAQTRSVAVFLDREGNDLYAAGDGRPALATDGSLAIFLDAAGQDRYVGLPAGSVPGRSGDAIGLFVDISGQDNYPDGLEDGAARVEPDGAVGYDLPAMSSGVSAEGAGPRPGSVADPGAEAIDALWREETSTASDRLVAIGLPALRRFLETRLKEADAWEMATTSRLARLLDESAKPAIVAKLASPDESELRNALILTGTVGALQAGPRVATLMKVPGVQRQAAEAAGLLRVSEAVPDLLPLAASPDSDLARTAMLALERIGSETSLATAQALVTSPQYPIRQSAMRLLARFSASATITADRLLGESDERLQRYGVELLGRLGTDDALNRVGKYLTSPSPGLKIEALLALNGHCPPAFRPTLLALRYDPNTAVRAVAARIDPGR